jgi:hypothetical protein
MKKCDFCTQSTPNGKCKKGGYLDNSYTRESYCKEAIEKMIKALQKRSDNNE